MFLDLFLGMLVGGFEKKEVRSAGKSARRVRTEDKRKASNEDKKKSRASWTPRSVQTAHLGRRRSSLEPESVEEKKGALGGGL